MVYVLTLRFNVRCSSCPRVALLHCYVHIDSLGAQRHAILFRANDASKPLTFKSFLMHSNHVFLGCTLGFLPVTIVLSTFLGHVSGSIRWRWPYQRRRPRLSTFSMLHRPNWLFSSSDVILSVSFVEQIHLIIIISLRWRWETSSCVAATFHWHAIRHYAHMHFRHNNAFSRNNDGKRELAKAL